MPAPAKTPTEAILGYGTTIEFLGLGFLARGTNFRGSRGAVDSVNVTNFDSPGPEGDRQWGGDEFIANSIGDPGQMSTSIIWTADQKLPAIGAEATIRVTFPLKKNAGYKTPTIWSGLGYLASADVSAETKTAYTADVVIQRSGVWTETAATK